MLSNTVIPVCILIICILCINTPLPNGGLKAEATATFKVVGAGFGENVNRGSVPVHAEVENPVWNVLVIVVPQGSVKETLTASEGGVEPPGARITQYEPPLTVIVQPWGGVQTIFEGLGPLIENE